MNAFQLQPAVTKALEDALAESATLKEQLAKERKRLEIVEEQLGFAQELIEGVDKLIYKELQLHTSKAASKRIEGAYNVIRTETLFEG